MDRQKHKLDTLKNNRKLWTPNTEPSVDAARPPSIVDNVKYFSLVDNEMSFNSYSLIRECRDAPFSACIGVIGEPQAGKSTVLAQLAMQTYRDYKECRDRPECGVALGFTTLDRIALLSSTISFENVQVARQESQQSLADSLRRAVFVSSVCDVVIVACSYARFAKALDFIRQVQYASQEDSNANSASQSKLDDASANRKHSRGNIEQPKLPSFLLAINKAPPSFFTELQYKNIKELPGNDGMHIEIVFPQMDKPPDTSENCIHAVILPQINQQEQKDQENQQPTDITDKFQLPTTFDAAILKLIQHAFLYPRWTTEMTEISWLKMASETWIRQSKLA